MVADAGTEDGVAKPGGATELVGGDDRNPAIGSPSWWRVPDVARRAGRSSARMTNATTRTPSTTRAVN